ncbi:MAG: YbhB/YbcL family Raf kinase inhibitor-like protein, partial [Schlesneria sp.]
SPRDNERGPRNPGPGNNAKSRSNLPQLTISSPALDADGKISAEFTCDGASASPPVEWTGAPPETKFFALSLWHTAPDMEKSYWVVYGIPANVTKIAKNAKSTGTIGLNDKRRAAYDPMCSKGPGVKTYHITVYALSAEPKLSPDEATRANLLSAIKEITIAEGTLDFQYERKK